MLRRGPLSALGPRTAPAGPRARPAHNPPKQSGDPTTSWGKRCAFFLAHAALTGGLRIPLRHALTFMLFGAWGVGVFFGAMQMAIKLSGGATAVVLLYTAPVWVAVF